jgi:hypothetical protein
MEKNYPDQNDELVSISVDSLDFESHELCPSSLARPSVFARSLVRPSSLVFFTIQYAGSISDLGFGRVYAGF